MLIKKNGKLTGVLVDNAVDLVKENIPAPTEKEMRSYFKRAEQDCFGVGLTSVHDAGLDRGQIEVIEKMHMEGALHMRMYVMLTPDSVTLNHYIPKGIYKTPYLNIRSIKLYADGALGSRGAALLESYHDHADHNGLMLQPENYYKEMAEKAYAAGFQVNTHAIGDAANRLMLTTYGAFLKGKNDRRWRIEHAQVIAKEDFNFFGRYSIIPSVQPTHATSDMYWAEERLGKTRLAYAYAYNDLLKQNGMIALGSDFPVEDINPLYGFHAAVARQDVKQWPEEGFQPENAISREEALKGMTIWAAYAAFEEQEKGSIETGKMADFVVLDRDIMQVPVREVNNAKVVYTYSGGERVYALKE